MSSYILAVVALLAMGAPAYAANTPCSGMKGGISHCRGDKFVCVDGSTSASKKDCSSYMGGAFDKDPSDPPPKSKQQSKPPQ